MRIRISTGYFNPTNARNYVIIETSKVEIEGHDLSFEHDRKHYSMQIDSLKERELISEKLLSGGFIDLSKYDVEVVGMECL